MIIFYECSFCSMMVRKDKVDKLGKRFAHGKIFIIYSHKDCWKRKWYEQFESKDFKTYNLMEGKK